MLIMKLIVCIYIVGDHTTKHLNSNKSYVRKRLGKCYFLEIFVSIAPAPGLVC